MSPFTRLTLRTLFGLLIGPLLLSAGARAENGGAAGSGGTTATTLSKEDFRLELRRLKNNDAEKNEWETVTTNAQPFLLNRANCECDTPVALFVALEASGRAKLSSSTTRNGNIDVVLGNQPCVSASVTERAAEACPQVGRIAASALLNGPALVVSTADNKFTVGRLFGAIKTGPAEACERRGTINALLFVDVNVDGIPDVSGASAPAYPLPLAGEPPPAPSDIVVRPGDEALEVRWKAVDNIPDLAGYAILCARDGDRPIFEGNRPDPDLNSASELCPEMVGQTPTNNPYQFLVDVDPRYACSGLINGSATSARISRLQNGITYVVGVTAIDKNGNASPIGTAQTAFGAPIATQDFYEGYRGAGGSAEGGYCATSARRGGPRAVEVMGAAVFIALALLARRRAARVKGKR